MGKRGASKQSIELTTTPASEIVMRAIEFLWPGWVVAGQVNILFGPGKRGKGQIAAAIAAHVSGGPALPSCSEQAPAHVLWMAAEDTLDDVLVPRLRAAGANLSLVRFVGAKCTDGEEVECLIQLARDADKIRRIVLETGAKLLVIDPLMAYLDEGIDAHRDNEVRRVMSALAALARDTGCTVLAVAHANKRLEGPANQRLGGSAGIYNAARCVLVVDRAKDGTGDGVLAVADGNLGAKGEGSLAFAFESVSLTEQQTRQTIPTSKITWLGRVKTTADELLAKPLPVRGSRGADAEDFVRRALARGPVLQSELERRARKEGLTGNAFRKARERLGVVSRPDGFQGQRWLSLPGEEQPSSLPNRPTTAPGTQFASGAGAEHPSTLSEGAAATAASPNSRPEGQHQPEEEV